jgi:hypothetical protein
MAPSARTSPIHASTAASLVLVFVAVAALWNTDVVTPLKLVVVLLHEISHGVAAVLTGGRIDRIEVNAAEGGVCYTSGGIRVVVLSAGYLGSMAWGAAILLLAARTRWDRVISMVLGAFILVMAGLYVRNLFGLALSVAFGGAMVAAGRYLPEEVNDPILKTIGLTSCMYAVLDILDDVLQRPGIGSDADMLAQLTHIPSVVWGAVWMVVSVVVSGWALVQSARGPRDREATSPPR